jgi:hypothetical protein
MRSCHIATVCVLSFVFHGVLSAGFAFDTELEAGEEGLVRIERTPFDAVSLAPDFNLAAFQEVGVDECTVGFRENWLRDQNRMRAPSQLVTKDDMQRIAEQLAASCHEIFAARLEGIVPGEDGSSGGTRTLTVRPAVVDLDVLAPDVQVSGRQTQLTTNTVRMSLQLELVDTSSGKTVGRIVDHRRSEETGHARPTSSVGNMADADRILRQWAALVREQLETSAN